MKINYPVHAHAELLRTATERAINEERKERSIKALYGANSVERLAKQQRECSK